MSSKKLQFKHTKESITKKLFNEINEMSDISFNTIANATENAIDIQMLTPEESIVQSLKNLMALPVGGNVLFPTRGEKVGNMLFTPGFSQDEAQTFILSYLNANEPRINVLHVNASKKIDEYNEQIVTLDVQYSFKNSQEIYNAIVDLKSTADLSNIQTDSNEDD